MKLNRRETLTLSATALAFIGLPGVAMAAEGDQHDQAKLLDLSAYDPALADRVLGSEDANVTVIEYASPTCPHCAAFHINVYPAFKEAYVDSGKAKFIVRPFVRNVLDAVVFMLAMTTDDVEAYHQILDTYFKTQNTWALSDKPKDALFNIAQQLGFTEETFEAALTNQVLFEGMDQMREQALNEFDLTGTPTFYINGKQLSGDKSLDELAAEIDPLLG